MIGQIKHQHANAKPSIKSSSLAILTLAVAFFSRVLAAMHIPSVVNFLHFPFVLLIFVIALPQIRSKIHVNISQKIIFGLYALIVAIVASAFFNKAGIINIVLDFLLLAEPFLMLLAIVGLRMTSSSIERFRFWLITFAVISLLFAYFESFVLHVDDEGGPDAIKGVFLNQGAGHHVGGAVALTTAVYFFITSKIRSVWIRALLAFAFIPQTYPLSDSKQVIVVFVCSLMLLTLTRFTKIVETLQYLIITLILCLTIYYSILNLFPGLEYWFNLTLLIDSFAAKYSVFSIIYSYYTSPLDWLFGLGPGHTIGRLAWLIPDYSQFLQPLGVTLTPVTAAIFAENDSNPLTNAITGSSMFSLTFSWAGIWGDLGLVGTGAYLYLWFVVLQKVCLDKLSKFFVFTMLIFGWIFSWLEEPAYMLFVTSIIGINWQNKIKN